MISIMALICIGGVSYLYSRLINFSCCTNGNNVYIPIISTTNSREIATSERSTLINRPATDKDEDEDEDENANENEDGDDYDDDDDLSEDGDSFENLWTHKSRQVSTFKNKNYVIKVLEKLSDSLHAKTVRFHPLSQEHVTFSKKEYKRRNDEFFENLMTIYKDPVHLFEIDKEVKVIMARMPKLETIYEHPDENVEFDS
jgi:hypothetical protein